jgi:signal transduction histidine kinase
VEQSGGPGATKVATPASLRHDVANELAVIVGFTELLLQDASADHAWRPDLEAIREAAQRATRLLAEMKTQVL